jgi:hypothetical protein
MAAPGFYAGRPEEIAAVAKRLEAIGVEIERCFGRWAELELLRG